jgi:hypothetical protein
MEPFLREVTSEAFSVSHMLGMIPDQPHRVRALEPDPVP